MSLYCACVGVCVLYICNATCMSNKRLRAKCACVSVGLAQACPNQKRNFDKQHKAWELRPLAPGDSVWIPSIQVEGTVEKEVTPRSYHMSRRQGSLCRNRQHLRPIPSSYTSFDGSHSEDIQLQKSTQTLPHPESILASTSGLTETATSQSAMGTSLPRAYTTCSGRMSVMPDRYRPTL